MQSSLETGAAAVEATAVAIHCYLGSLYLTGRKSLHSLWNVRGMLASVWLQSQSSRIGPRLCRSFLVGLSCWVEQQAQLRHLSYRLVSHILGRLL